MTLPARIGWVWQDAPPARWPAGLDAALVRAANGAGHTGTGGVDFARNYAAWARAFPGRVLPWTWVGPPASSNGAACADALHLAAPGAPLYVADIEGTLAPAEVVAFCARMRRHEMACLLGFSSYPTREQAMAHGVPWDACVGTFDVGLPQVYWPAQRARLDQVIADHLGRPVHVAVSPGDDPGWLDAAHAGMGQHAGASVWRYGLDGFGQWAATLGRLEGGDDMFTDDDRAKLTAVHQQITGAVGAGQTSFAGTVEATLATVQGLVNEGRSQASTLAGRLDSMRSALLGALAALPTAHLTDGERAQLAADVADRLGQAGVQLDPAAILDALAVRLAA